MEDLPPRERIRRLLELVSRLTFDEVRQLSARLADVDFRSDIFSRLPLEVQILISEQLDRREIWPCLIVSKQWRTALLADAILASLAKRCFPGLLEWAAEAGKDAKAEFVEAARSYYFRSTGKFRSALSRQLLYLDTETYFRLDPVLHAISHSDDCPYYEQNYSHFLARPLRTRWGQRGTDPNLARLQYRNGRLAWQPTTRASPDSGLVVVDDLRTRLRKVFKYPGMALIGDLHLIALGDRLVVGGMGSILQVLSPNQDMCDC